MRKNIFLIILFLILANSTIAQNAFCCVYYPGSQGPGAGSPPPSYSWSCDPCSYPQIQAGVNECRDKLGPPRDCSGTGTGVKPGEVYVTWTTVTVSVCPPGILGSAPCNYPGLEDLIKRINQLLLTIAPPTLVILIIIGGLMYLLTPFGVENYIKKGHKYIQYAILGFIILLLATLIFSIISAILGGPNPPANP